MRRWRPVLVWQEWLASEFDPRKALVAAKNAARGIVKARFEAFGCAGQASKIKPVPLEMMARRYQ